MERVPRLAARGVNMIQEVLTDVKVGSTVAAGSGGTWLLDVPEWAALAGLILSVVLIYTHTRSYMLTKKRERLEREKLHLEIEKMKNDTH